MLCLGVETSCDDTALALVKDGKLLHQVCASQAELHALFGGVVPEIASREHGRCLGPLLDVLLAEAEVTVADLNVIAVARGPGLLGSLLAGVAFAKALAFGCGARFIGINHLHAHLMAVGLEQELSFPAVGLLVSGGHTHLYAIDSPMNMTVLGKTLDDAAGEAFDKAGKLLGLPYPAGRIMNALAKEGTAVPKLFPRPYLDNDHYNFSFSGLKTAMGVYLGTHRPSAAKWDAATGSVLLPEGPQRQQLADLCASYTLAIVETLIEKTRRVLQQYTQSRSVILAGGVAANSFLRDAMASLSREFDKDFFCPSPLLCTDNGAMVAYLGWLLAQEGYAHSLAMPTIPRGQSVPDDYEHIYK